MVGKIINFFDRHFWLLALILSIPAIYGLYDAGLMSIHDEMHVAWLYEMHQTILMWQIPPRYVPDLSFGFGYPLFHYVFPLPFYIAEIFHLIGFNLVNSIKAVYILSLPLSALFMYFLLRNFTSKAISLFGAVLYCYTPYRALDVYVRGAVGEAFSFVFLPLIVLSVCKLTEENEKQVNFRWIGIGSLSLASLLLCHNITAYMFIPFVVILALLRLIFLCQKKVLVLIQLGISILLGLLMSAYFWMPALLDSKLVKYDTVYNFIDHFPTLKQLITPFWGYGASVAGPYDGISFFLGFISIAMMVIGIILTVLFWKKYNMSEKLLLIWAIASFFAAIFMMNFRSSVIWESVPFIAYFQFPWRFLIVTTFMAPLMAISLQKIKFSKILAIILIIPVITLSWNYFQPSPSPHKFDEYFINRYIPVPIATSAYYTIGEEYLRLPQATKIRPDKNYPLIEITNGQILKVDQKNRLESLVEVEASVPTVLTYNKYNFPGWVALINNQEVEINSGQPFGQITVDVPEGKNVVKIAFGEPPFRLILDLFSLSALLLILGFIFRENAKKVVRRVKLLVK